MADQPPYPGIPRWVKVSAVVIIVLLLLVVVVLVTGVGGDHGPGRHSGSGDNTPAVSVPVADTPPAGSD